MSDCGSEKTNVPEKTDENTAAVGSAAGMSPYATGGGGVTFERKVAVQYLAHLLLGDGADEFGEGRRAVSVAFQQAPDYPVDDLVIQAARPEEVEPSLELALGVRRSPNLVLSDEPTQKLIREFVRAVINTPANGPESRLGLVVAGSQQHAGQLGQLASFASSQMTAPGFLPSSTRQANSMLALEAGLTNSRSWWAVRFSALVKPTPTPRWSGYTHGNFSRGSQSSCPGLSPPTKRTGRPSRMALSPWREIPV